MSYWPVCFWHFRPFLQNGSFQELSGQGGVEVAKNKWPPEKRQRSTSQPCGQPDIHWTTAAPLLQAWHDLWTQVQHRLRGHKVNHGDGASQYVGLPGISQAPRGRGWLWYPETSCAHPRHHLIFGWNKTGLSQKTHPVPKTTKFHYVVSMHCVVFAREMFGFFS